MHKPFHVPATSERPFYTFFSTDSTLLLKLTMNLRAVADFHLHSFPPPREAAGQTEAHSCCRYERGMELWVMKAGGSHAGDWVQSPCFTKRGGKEATVDHKTW